MICNKNVHCTQCEMCEDNVTVVIRRRRRDVDGSHSLPEAFEPVDEIHDDWVKCHRYGTYSPTFIELKKSKQTDDVIYLGKY